MFWIKQIVIKGVRGSLYCSFFPCQILQDKQQWVVPCMQLLQFVLFVQFVQASNHMYVLHSSSKCIKIIELIFIFYFILLKQQQ